MKVRHKKGQEGPRDKISMHDLCLRKASSPRATFTLLMDGRTVRLYT
jgi:hypothetical protein